MKVPPTGAEHRGHRLELVAVFGVGRRCVPDPLDAFELRERILEHLTVRFCELRHGHVDLGRLGQRRKSPEPLVDERLGFGDLEIACQGQSRVARHVPLLKECTDVAE